MLYDHTIDKVKNVNVVNLTKYKEIVSGLKQILHTVYQKNIEGESYID